MYLTFYWFVLVCLNTIQWGDAVGNIYSLCNTPVFHTSTIAENNTKSV